LTQKGPEYWRAQILRESIGFSCSNAWGSSWGKAQAKVGNLFMVESCSAECHFLPPNNGFGLIERREMKAKKTSVIEDIFQN